MAEEKLKKQKKEAEAETGKEEGKGKSRKHVGFRRSAITAALILSLASTVLGVPQVESEMRPEKGKKTETTEGGLAQGQAAQAEPDESLFEDTTRIRTSISQKDLDTLSTDSKGIKAWYDEFATVWPYVAGMHIVDSYHDIPIEERAIFDEYIFIMVDTLEKRKEFEDAGGLCINHIYINGSDSSSTLSLGTILLLLNKAKKNFEKAATKCEGLRKGCTKRGDANGAEGYTGAIEYYQTAVKDIEKKIDELEK